jgi:hypothetical protein
MRVRPRVARMSPATCGCRPPHIATARASRRLGSCGLRRAHVLQMSRKTPRNAWLYPAGNLHRFNRMRRRRGRPARRKLPPWRPGPAPGPPPVFSKCPLRGLLDYRLQKFRKVLFCQCVEYLFPASAAPRGARAGAGHRAGGRRRAQGDRRQYALHLRNVLVIGCARSGTEHFENTHGIRADQATCPQGLPA